MNSATHAKGLAIAALLPFFIAFSIFQITPLFLIVIGSFQHEDTGWGIGNYAEIFSSVFYLQAFRHSIGIAIWSSCIGMIIAVMVSFSLRRLEGSRLHNWILSITNVSSNFSGVPLAFAFIVLLGLNGIFTLLLKKAGLIGEFNLYSRTGLIIIYTYFQIPLGVLLLYPAFDAWKKQWQEAVALLGGRPWHFWIYIGIPVILPSLCGTFIILIANALGAYATIFALTGGNFNIVPIRISSLVAGDVSLNPNLASAFAMLLLALITLVMCVQQWVLRSSYIYKTKNDAT